MRNLILAFLLCAMAAGQTTPSLNAARLMVVTTPGWDAVSGTLTRYELRGGKWRRLGRRVRVVVGKAGMAWDPKLARGPSMLRGPVKREGDNRSPAGIFPIKQTFGFAADSQPNYIVLTPTTECVDDSKSKHYTQVLDRSQTPDVDWNSSERMRSIEGYRWGAVVGYNMEAPAPGNGSCIFLHVWEGPGKGTSGCTAMPEDSMKALVRWLGAGRTVLVQMPLPEYQKLRQAWGLP